MEPRRTHAPDARFWFPAKKYGWGWGLPVAWQGWVVTVMWLGMIAGGAVVLAGEGYVAGFVLYSIIMAAVLVGVCWWKGEPPRWRWGE